jgi:hypothetical protein
MYCNLPGSRFVLHREILDVVVTCLMYVAPSEKKGFLSSIGLDDWKFALPIGLVIGQAAIANEVCLSDCRLNCL